MARAPPGQTERIFPSPPSHYWKLQTHQVIEAAENYANPTVASRVLAMVHPAMHDAVNAAQPRYRACAHSPPPGTRADADAAVAAAVAAHDVLAALYPKQKNLLRSTLESTLLDAGIGAPIEQGRKLGAAAAAVLARAFGARVPFTFGGAWSMAATIEGSRVVLSLGPCRGGVIRVEWPLGG